MNLNRCKSEDRPSACVLCLLLAPLRNMSWLSGVKSKAPRTCTIQNNFLSCFYKLFKCRTMQPQSLFTSLSFMIKRTCLRFIILFDWQTYARYHNCNTQHQTKPEKTVHLSHRASEGLLYAIAEYCSSRLDDYVLVNKIRGGMKYKDQYWLRRWKMCFSVRSNIHFCHILLFSF